MLIATGDNDFEKEWFECKGFTSTKELAFYFWNKGKAIKDTPANIQQQVQADSAEKPHRLTKC